MSAVGFVVVEVDDFFFTVVGVCFLVIAVVVVRRLAVVVVVVWRLIVVVLDTVVVAVVGCDEDDPVDTFDGRVGAAVSGTGARRDSMAGTATDRCQSGSMSRSLVSCRRFVPSDAIV